MKKVSIIVPVYNTGKYIKKCIESLLNQTHKNLEIILINDGSKDNSEEIILSYKDSRIKYIAKENEGIGKTRNLGIEVASGDYLMFIDSDDYIREDCVEKFLQKCQKTNCDLVISNFYEDKKVLKEVKYPYFEDSSLKDNPDILNKVNLGPCNKIYSKELFSDPKNRFVEDLKYEDAPFVCRMLCTAKKIGKIDECLSYYVIHDNSQTTVRDKKTYDIIRICKIIDEDLREFSYLDIQRIDLLVMILTDYTIQQRYISDKKVRDRFIDDAFIFLNTLSSKWRKTEYLNNFSKLKRIVKTNKFLTKFYCNIYNLKEVFK